MIGHKHYRFIETEGALHHNLKVLYPDPHVKGVTLLVCNDVCYPNEGSENFRNLFENHPYCPITYPMIVECNDKILAEIDSDETPFDPIFERSVYWQNYSAQLISHIQSFKPTSYLAELPYLYHTDALFALYSSLKALKTAYGARSVHQDPYWVSIFGSLLKQGWFYAVEMLQALYFQPILEIMLSVWRIVISKHTDIGLYAHSAITFGKFSFEGMLRMYMRELFSIGITSSNFMESFILTWVEIFDQGNMERFTSEVHTFLTKLRYQRLGELVRDGRAKRDLAGLKMLLIHSPMRIECDIYKLPNELVFMIGSFLHPNEDLVRAVVLA